MKSMLFFYFVCDILYVIDDVMMALVLGFVWLCV